MNRNIINSYVVFSKRNTKQQCDALIKLGFVIKKQNSWGSVRLQHSGTELAGNGSLYINEEYISATGSHEDLLYPVKSTCVDRHMYPCWKGADQDALHQFLLELRI